MSWSAAQYSIFEDQRTRPVRDLLAALPSNLEAAVARFAADGPWSRKLVDVAKARTSLADAEWYYELLRTSCAAVDVWRTTYHHSLPGGASAVVEWFKGSGLRPFLDPLDEAASLHRSHQARLHADGGISLD